MHWASPYFISEMRRKSTTTKLEDKNPPPINPIPTIQTLNPIIRAETETYPPTNQKKAKEDRPKVRTDEAKTEVTGSERNTTIKKAQRKLGQRRTRT